MAERERHIMMTSPDHFEVSYAINPWMDPDDWAHDASHPEEKAREQWQALADQLRARGVTLHIVPAARGLPDLVFPANAGIVFDGRVLVARFRHPERQGEEALFLRFFEGLREQGLVSEVRQLPEGVYQEGAGDCIWDAHRRMFWVGYGQRSVPESVGHIRDTFGQPAVALELVTPQYYHLDTCFCVLPRGEVMYFPEAFSPAAQAEIARRVPPAQRILATAEEAATFCLNAVVLDDDVIMAPPPPRLRAEIEARGYRCVDVDLSNFKRSGGAAYCMTLRLDLASQAAPATTETAAPAATGSL